MRRQPRSAWHELFEMVRGDPALLVAADSQAGDIIVVAQPRLPAERLVHATRGVWRRRMPVPPR